MLLISTKALKPAVLKQLSRKNKLLTFDPRYHLLKPLADIGHFEILYINLRRSVFKEPDQLLLNYVKKQILGTPTVYIYNHHKYEDLVDADFVLRKLPLQTDKPFIDSVREACLLQHQEGYIADREESRSSQSSYGDNRERSDKIHDFITTMLDEDNVLNGLRLENELYEEQVLTLTETITELRTEVKRLSEVKPVLEIKKKEDTFVITDDRITVSGKIFPFTPATKRNVIRQAMLHRRSISNAKL